MTTQSLSGQPSQVPGLTPLDRRRIQRAAELVAGEDHGPAAVTVLLGLADNEHLYRQAFTVTCNYLDLLLAVIEHLTGNAKDETTVADGDPVTLTEAVDALVAIREALDIPHGATVGDQETRDRILVERVVPRGR